MITGIGVEKCVRLQFGANAVADECRLVLDIRGDNARTLQVDCSIMISIPSGASANANDKLDLATLRIIIHFSPETSNPFVKYQLVSYRFANSWTPLPNKICKKYGSRLVHWIWNT